MKAKKQVSKQAPISKLLAPRAYCFRMKDNALVDVKIGSDPAIGLYWAPIPSDSTRQKPSVDFSEVVSVAKVLNEYEGRYSTASYDLDNIIRETLFDRPPSAHRQAPTSRRSCGTAPVYEPKADPKCTTAQKPRLFYVRLDVEIEIDDPLLTSALTTEWRQRHYHLLTPGAVAAHLAYNLVQGRRLRTLDGFADQPPEAARILNIDVDDGEEDVPVRSDTNKMKGSK